MKKQDVILAILAVILFLTSGANSAELPTVEVGLAEDGVFGLGGYYIIEKQLDRKNGFIMKPRWAGAGGEIQRLLAIGAIPLGLAVPEVTLRANLQGTQIRLVQPFQVSHNFVLVRKDAPYRDILEIRGKPLALTTETSALYNVFDYIMRKRGVKIESEFQLKKLAGAGAIIAVLEKGEVEGAVLWEAHVSRMLATGRYRAIMGFREEEDKLFKGSAVFFSYLGAIDSWVKQNPEMISKVRAAWQEAIKGVQNDEAHFRKYAKRLFALEKPEELDLGWKRTRTILVAPDLVWPNASGLEVQKRYLSEATELGIFPKEAKEHIDNLFVP